MRFSSRGSLNFASVLRFRDLNFSKKKFINKESVLVSIFGKIKLAEIFLPGIKTKFQGGRKVLNVISQEIPAQSDFYFL